MKNLRIQAFARSFSAAAVLGLLFMTPSEASSVPGQSGSTLPTNRSLPAPPKFDVRLNRPGTASGMLFTTPQAMTALDLPHGPEILDKYGRPVWFQPLKSGELASDLRVQHYRGKPVLTWWQGSPGERYGLGTVRIADTHYRIIATIKGVTAPADLHDVRITSRGTALLTEYQRVKTDLRPYGGPKNGTVLNGVIEEINLSTGTRIWQWNSLDHIRISETDMPYIPSDVVFDYFHINSVDETPDGNLLVSARNTSTIYKIDRKTGKIIWRLGGRNSTFRLDPGARFTGQHDAAWAGTNLIRLFDNGTIFLSEGYESRVSWIQIDLLHKTAHLVKQVVHPDHLATVRSGNAQALPNGNTMVSWGPTGRISEFSPKGGLLFDAAVHTGTYWERRYWESYRVYRFPWKGMPTTPPTAVLQGGFVHAIWNGATEVARWRLLAGSTRSNLRPIGERAWNGLDTVLTLPTDLESTPYIKVEALDAKGNVVGVSDFAQGMQSDD